MRRSYILGLVALNSSFGLTLLAGTVPEENPFTSILVRNVFGLQSASTNTPVDTLAMPPVKIVPNGIMTLFGRSQVLFKVLDAPSPGQPPPKEQAYLMSEGENQDGIEVQKIDVLSAVITFNNHGAIQELPLISGSASDGGRYNDPGTFNASRNRLLAARRLATDRRLSEPNPYGLNEMDAANASGSLAGPDFNSATSGQVITVPESVSSEPRLNSVPAQAPALQQNRNSTAANNSSAGNAAQVNNGGDETLTPAEAAGGDVPPLSQ